MNLKLNKPCALFLTTSTWAASSNASTFPSGFCPDPIRNFWEIHDFSQKSCRGICGGFSTTCFRILGGLPCHDVGKRSIWATRKGIFETTRRFHRFSIKFWANGGFEGYPQLHSGYWISDVMDREYCEFLILRQIRLMVTWGIVKDPCRRPMSWKGKSLHTW